MKQLFQITARKFALAALMAFTLVFPSLSAFAQSHDKPVFRAEYPGETRTGYLTASWEPSLDVRHQLAGSSGSAHVLIRPTVHHRPQGSPTTNDLRPNSPTLNT